MPRRSLRLKALSSKSSRLAPGILRSMQWKAVAQWVAAFLFAGEMLALGCAATPLVHVRVYVRLVRVWKNRRLRAASGPFMDIGGPWHTWHGRWKPMKRTAADLATRTCLQGKNKSASQRLCEHLCAPCFVLAPAHRAVSVAHAG
jgi:hypothetical protein